MTFAPLRPISHPVRLFALAAACMLALLPAWASAQSLRELYDAARAYDATYLAARAQADSAQYRAAQADALNRPNVGLVANASRTDVEVPPTVTGPDRRPIPLTSGHFFNNRVDATVSAIQPLYNRGNDATISQAQRGLEVAQADLETAEQDLIIRVAQAYFDVLAAYDALVTSQTGKRAIAEQLASAKRNFEVGTATITDTREAQARFDLSTAQEIAAENDLRTKRVALDTLVGRANVVPKPLAEPVTLPGPAPDDVDVWVNTADQVHPLIRKARLGLEVARLETERARAAEGVTLDLVGQVGASRLAGNASNAPGTSTIGLIGLQMKLPLYTGGATQNRIKETLSLEDKARNDLEAARRGVAQGTRVAFLGVKSGRAQVNALEAAESSTKLALEATQLGYRVGVRVNIDVLNAQT
ncbi:MAG TPA: TolC family outer membrane protein, partial [Burkholderiaceae bacterium]|nr:TolC family outer membrane protein [Burkholderiaceae bacterium]